MGDIYLNLSRGESWKSNILKNQFASFFMANVGLGDEWSVIIVIIAHVG